MGIFHQPWSVPFTLENSIRTVFAEAVYCPTPVSEVECNTLVKWVTTEVAFPKVTTKSCGSDTNAEHTPGDERLKVSPRAPSRPWRDELPRVHIYDSKLFFTRRGLPADEV